MVVRFNPEFKDWLMDYAFPAQWGKDNGYTFKIEDNKGHKLTVFVSCDRELKVLQAMGDSKLTKRRVKQIFQMFAGNNMLIEEPDDSVFPEFAVKFPFDENAEKVIFE